jgi:Spy/CpxP family protein refolding chaperone
MISFRFLLPALCVVGLGGAAVYAYAGTTDPAPGSGTPSGHHWHGPGRGRGHGGFWYLLKELDLTAEQKTAIKAILTQARTQNSALRASIRANRESLAITAPTDPGYPALIATAKANAAAGIDAMSSIKTQIYAVLTPQQIAQIPTIIANERAAWKAKAAAWRAAHDPA